GRCRAEQRAGGLRRVAYRAARLDDTADLVELAVSGRAFLLLTDAGLFRRGRSQVLRDGLAVGGEHEGQADHADRGRRQGPGEAVAVVAGVEVVAYQYRQRAECGQDQPVVLAAVGAREVVADHDEQHRQGEIVVVARTQQALGRQYRVRGAALDRKSTRL